MKTAIETLGSSAHPRHTGISRRRFLWLMLGIGGGLLVRPGLTLPTARWRAGQNLLLSRFTGLLQNQESAKAIGAAYAQEHPQEAAIPVLLDHIVTSIGGAVAISGGVTDEDLKQLLQQRIQQDFAEEAVVKLQGWILSTTEARLCALTTLV